MKKNILVLCTALLCASPLLSKAQTEIAQWTFENLAITNYAPNPAPNLDNSAGAVSVSELGMTNWPTTGYGTNDPDVLQGAGKDSSGVASGGDGITNTTKEFRVRATGLGNGWSSQAAVGTQGVQFSVDTTGFGNIQVAFDWYLTAQGEANLQLEYTVDGTNWSNAAITIPAAQAGTFATFVDNTSGSDANSVQGYYIHSVAYTGGQQWFTNLTATITNPAAANNPNFAIRIVNASTGTACVSGTGGALNNNSGNWRFDNIGISGTALPKPIAQWTFEGVPKVVTLDPAPYIDNSAGAVSAASIGMEQFGSGTTNDPDVTLGATGDTGTDGITNYTQIWRVRGAPGNGWTSTAKVGTQGAQFTVDTTGYTNITVAFDWYLTTQGEANLQLQYTLDGINWVNIPITVPAAQLGSYIQNVDNTSDSDPNSVQGYYVNALPNGQQWFTNLTAVITNPAAANNPVFGIRMVNASTGASCVNSDNQPLNNNSGNWRFDNIIISGLGSAGGITVQTPPTITASTSATVDGPFTNTFTDNIDWRTNIYSVTVNGSLLPNAAYVISAGQIVYTPSVSPLLQKAGTINFEINATNFTFDTVAQILGAGAPKGLIVKTQPQAPTGNGGTLVGQPTLELVDQYNNVASSGTANAIYTATPSAGWYFGPGSGVSVVLTNGTASFTNLSAVSAFAVPGATITFTASSLSGLSALAYTTTNSSAFNIPAPVVTSFTPGDVVVELEDVASANSTFSMLELNPSNADQTPVVFPVPATGTNALRQSSSGSTGRLSDSQDGTLLCFSAGLCGDSTVSDITALNGRGAGTFNFQGDYVLQTTYQGAGGSVANQARSVTTFDDITFWMGDKGGVFTNNETTNNGYIVYTAANGVNVRSLRAYNGIIYAMQQEGGTDPTASVMAMVPPPADSAQFLTELEGFPIDPDNLDFCAIASGAHGTNIDVIYYDDATNVNSGGIQKYTNSFTMDPETGEQIWASTGPGWNTPNGGDGFACALNPQGGADLYYTTGTGGTTGNSVIHLYDSAPWNLPINVTATNVLYTASAGATLKGVAFAPIAPATVPTYPVGTLIGINSVHLSGGANGGNLTFEFTSTTAGVRSSFTVWSTTNIALPFNQWNNLGHPEYELPAGTYNFIDQSGATNGAEFYRVTSP